ncbi:MAG: hypothetical protein EOP84_11820 [Verrucomicrobiaceae bacterium]|nr:MAG: hypothetical protein EOP84_11820 [Verrucomicrobiaceae bacterium]
MDTAKKDLTKTKDDLTTANKTIDETKQKLSAAETEAKDAKAKADQLAKDIEDRSSKIAALEQEIVSMKTGTGADGQADPKVVQLEEDLKRAVAERDELKAVQDTLNARVQEADQRLQTAQATVQRYQKGIANQSLSGRVLAVNQGWNFVVLDVGDRQGAAVNAPLLVLRGGQPIARLKITSVEPSTSIADVVPGSMARGMTVQPNDRVVFAGNRNQRPQPVGGQPVEEAAPAAPAAPQPSPAGGAQLPQ